MGKNEKKRKRIRLGEKGTIYIVIEEKRKR